MDIKRCKKLRKGITLVQPNKELSLKYIDSAFETIKVSQKIKNSSNMWLATTKYYCEYFCIYSLLIRLGIKCEIHDCTIELSNFLEERGYLKNGISNLLDDDKNLRIENQYYLKNYSVNFRYNEIFDLILYFKNLINSLSNGKIKKIRELLT